MLGPFSDFSNSFLLSSSQFKFSSNKIILRVGHRYLLVYGCLYKLFSQASHTRDDTGSTAVKILATITRDVKTEATISFYFFKTIYFFKLSFQPVYERVTGASFQLIHQLKWCLVMIYNFYEKKLFHWVWREMPG